MGQQERRGSRTQISLALAVVFVGLASWPDRGVEAAEGITPGLKPNIVFILADDYGIPGVSCYGGEFKTPNLDALAAGGIRFERCFSAPLCGPSRALGMFGRYAFRTGVLTNESGPAAKPDKEISIAKVLKQAGYATGLSGKWNQLEYLSTPAEAQAWGFDEFLRWERPWGERYWGPALNKNGQRVPVTEKSYGPDLLHEFAVDFIRRHRHEPFFLYYPMTLIHGPILPTPDSREAQPTKTKDKAPQFYADNVAYLDKLVGKLVAEIDALGLRERTLIVFTGDNGSVGRHKVHGRLVDGGKGSLLEGGSRVPLIVNWKGVTPAGRVLNDLVDFSDFFATFAEVAGVKPPEGVILDSHSFAPQLRGEKGSPREWVFVQLGAQWYARNDRWKLNQRGELFDMSDAPYTEKLMLPDAETADATVARHQLQAVLDKLHPAGGATEAKPQKADAPKKAAKKKRRQDKAD